MGSRIWYDEFTLKIGDSLRRSIDRGLVESKFGIVVLSPDFFRKNWPKYELDGLVANEQDGNKVILPLWHRSESARIVAGNSSRAITPAYQAGSPASGRTADIRLVLEDVYRRGLNVMNGQFGQNVKRCPRGIRRVAHLVVGKHHHRHNPEILPNRADRTRMPIVCGETSKRHGVTGRP